MANKIFWLGILVTVLVFGMTVVGCGDDPTNNDGVNFEGTWTKGEIQLIINGNEFTTKVSGVNQAKGIFSTDTKTRTLTIAVTHYSRSNTWNELAESATGNYNFINSNEVVISGLQEGNLFTFVEINGTWKR